MHSSPTEVSVPLAQDVKVGEDTLTVHLLDGRTVTVPLSWYPRLAHGSPAERGRWELTGRGHGIHWPELDEDNAIQEQLAGRRSGESQSSLQKWLSGRGR